MPGDTPRRFWKNSRSGKLIVRPDGRLTLCFTCPCCDPKVLASKITNRLVPGMEVWDLTPYQGDGIGTPGGVWRLRDVGESHHLSPGAGCTGIIYHIGDIDGNGRLRGLPAQFVSKYSYNGYMELQQGCRDEKGTITWPCP